jgi:hypothetical protein
VKIAGRIDEASALMEAFRLSEAAATAAEAAAMAAACRNALFEARAEWLSRALAYRTGQTDVDGAPDLPLVEAAALLGAPHLEGLIRLTEAAVAYRAGDRATARAIVEPGYRLWSEAGHPLGPLLSGALLLASGGALREGEPAVLVERALRCEVAGVGPQALALLAEGGVAVPVDDATLQALADRVPRRFWGRRMEVLSVDESLGRMGRRALAEPAPPATSS